ncbi:amino acid permease [Exophiala viscosa]|uniref:amino acid permease n=1 Tax=Exophiala viscosa TaxID=2486360 RepID=UPI00219EC596|nr:amino acid permease [Exophiala viscosa]
MHTLEMDMDGKAHESVAMPDTETLSVNEAAVATLDIRYGHVKRGLKARHIQFIALGGTIGTSLFLGIGSSLTTAGPLSLLLGFLITGIAVYGMLVTLGEMATWLPIPGAIPQFCSRFVDDALGFAVGWNNWYFCAIVLCLEIDAAAIVIQYWPGARDITPAAWITLIIFFVVCLNIFAVSIYGEAEFVFASIKLITIFGLLIISLVIVLGGGPTHDRLGFRYWKNPGAMKPLPPATGDTGRFLGFFSVLVYAAFTYAGVEMVAAAAGEAENPRKNVPKAVRRVLYRILFFYVFGTLAIGLIVSSDDPNLLSAQKNGAAGAAESPWVIGIRNAGISALPSVINAVILTSAISSANAFLYTGSRYLYALAQNGHAPRIFLRCSKSGVPMYAVGMTAATSLLTYMTVSVAGANVFLWFASLITVASLLTWMSICFAFIRFRKAQIVQGVETIDVGFMSRFQPYTAWATLAYFAVVTFFNGFQVFMHDEWSVSNFITAYIGLPAFAILFIFWKLVKRTKLHPLKEIDLISGKREVDAMEGQWPEMVPKNFLQKVWFWIA